MIHKESTYHVVQCYWINNILLHGNDDAIIPYTESIALAAATHKGRSGLFLIDGLAHVNVRPFGIDRSAMRRAIGALLAERD